jgi:Tfp pilus assembly protein PilF
VKALAEVLSALRGRLAIVIGYLERGDEAAAERELDAAINELRAALAVTREEQAAA